MICRNCGKENKEGTAFCIGCGNPLGAYAGKNDGPTAVFTALKKKNTAAIAFGALSLVLAIALAFSLTGVLGAAGGQASAASKSFGTPEDAINYYVGCMKIGDFDGALSACAINEMAQGFDCKAFAGRLRVLMPLSTTLMPSEYEQYVKYNRVNIEKQIMAQMVSFTVSFNISEENTGLINGQSIMLPDGKLPDGFIEQLDPSKLSKLKMIEIAKANKHDIELNRKNQKEQARMYGADDIQFRTVLYEYDGKLYIGGFTIIEYNGRWLIQNMSDPLAGIPFSGMPIPVSDRSMYEDMLE